MDKASTIVYQQMLDITTILHVNHICKGNNAYGLQDIYTRARLDLT